MCLIKKGTPVLDQPEKGEIPKREEPNGDERRRQTVEAQLLLHQLQNARERHQVQTRSHPNPDRARREPVHHSSAIQVHRVRQDVRGPRHQGHIHHDAVHLVRWRRGRGHIGAAQADLS